MDCLGSLRSLRFKGVEATFAEQVKAPEGNTKALLPANPQLDGLPPEVQERLARVVAWHGETEEPLGLRELLEGKHPRDAIIRAWQMLEERILEAAALYAEAEGKPPYSVRRTVPEALDYLQTRSGRLSEGDRGLLIALMELRDYVVNHCFPVSRKVAESYLRAAVRASGPLYVRWKSARWAVCAHRSSKGRDTSLQ